MAIDDIIKENLHVVETLAYQHVRKCPEMTADDFIGEGNMALVMAARKWNPEKEPVFAHYAIYHIRKAMERIMPHGEIKKNLSDKIRLILCKAVTDISIEEVDEKMISSVLK